MEIGNLKHRIILQKAVITVDENRIETQDRKKYKTLWAQVSNLYGKEYFEAAAVQKEKTVKFVIRATSGIDESMRIVFQGKPYNIIFIDHIKYEKKYMEIKALEVGEHEDSN